MDTHSTSDDVIADTFAKGTLDAMVAGIVAAYVGNNHVSINELPDVIKTVRNALIAPSDTPAAPSIEKPTPAQIKKSITPGHLISFEDGKSYKTLRRHLTMRGLTPESYRAKWGLSPDYPMTSANYSEQRSELARALGLGHQRRKDAQEPRAAAKTASTDETVASEPPAKKPRTKGKIGIA